MPYQPVAGSLAHRVIAHLRANPEDELTAADVAKLFQANRNSITALLVTACNQGALARRKDGDVPVYSAGPLIHLCELPPSTDEAATTRQATATGGAELATAWGPRVAPAPAPPAPPSPSRPPPRDPLPLTTLKVEKGIPLPPPRTGRSREAEWAALLNGMDVGDSFACPPGTAKKLFDSVHRFAKRAGGMKFALRRDVQGADRIWRIE